MKVGYARVSIIDHDMAIQLAALCQAGCEQIFADDFDGVWKNLPGLETALTHMQGGDVLVVWRLERLARSLKQLVDTVNHLQERGLGFQSLQESIDTATSEGGWLIFQACSILAQAERDMIRERTKIGLRAARARGRMGGRPKKLDTDTTEMAYELYDSREHSVSEICGLLGISKSTLYRYLNMRERK
jgi:DNA invertase Pin-like site-specific DNA recombinase